MVHNEERKRVFLFSRLFHIRIKSVKLYKLVKLSNSVKVTSVISEMVIKVRQQSLPEPRKPTHLPMPLHLNCPELLAVVVGDGNAKFVLFSFVSFSRE